MNILLVYPDAGDTYFSRRDILAFARKRAISPPTGLLTVAALLPAAWGKRFIDLNFQRLAAADLAWADYVFISALGTQRDEARALVAHCHAAGKPVVAGGWLFTVYPEWFPDVDHLVLDEAEVTLPRFLADLSEGRPQRVYRADARADLHASPVPLWHLASLKDYAVVDVQYARGCPHQCSFCNIPVVLGQELRCKTAAQLVAELDALYAAGWREDVFIADDNFGMNAAVLKRDVLPAIIAWRKGKQKFPFMTQACISIADDPDLLRLMVAAGFLYVLIGIESPDDTGLQQYRKTQNLRVDLAAAVHRIQRAGMVVCGSLIVGSDTDTPTVFDQCLSFIRATNMVLAKVSTLHAPHGTELHRTLEAQGRLLTAYTGNNLIDTMNFVPRMDPLLIRDGYRRVQRTLFAWEQSYPRIQALLKEIGPVGARVPDDARRTIALFRVMWRLGVKSPERLQFWRLLLWTLTHRPSLFPLAVSLAVYCYGHRTYWNRIWPATAAGA